MKKSIIFNSLIGITGLLALYQLPLLETVLAKQDISISINDVLPYSKNAQQEIENNKIILMNKFENLVAFNPVLEDPEILNEAFSNTDFLNKVEENSKEFKIGDTAEEILANQQCQVDCKVLMVGDSMMGDLTYSMRALLRKNKPDWKVIDGHKVSSGLTNKNFYDWQATLKQLMDVNKPDYVFVLIGTNDAQGIKDENGKVVPFKQEMWKEVYGKQVKDFVATLDESKASWYWLDLPVVRQAGFNNKLSVIREVQKSTVESKNIDIQSIFGDSSNPQAFEAKYRNKDGIHFNSVGANQLATYIYENKLKVLNSPYDFNNQNGGEKIKLKFENHLYRLSQNN